MRKQIPADHSRVSISTTATKIRDILPKLNTCSIETRKPLIRNCVYKYACPCGKVYIGETKRRLAVRIKEHEKSGAIRDHVNGAPLEPNPSRHITATSGLRVG